RHPHRDPRHRALGEPAGPARLERAERPGRQRLLGHRRAGPDRVDGAGAARPRLCALLLPALGARRRRHSSRWRGARGRRGLARAIAGAATLLLPALVVRVPPLMLTIGLQALILPAAIGVAAAPHLGLAVLAAYLRAACRGMAEALFTQFVMERVPPRLRGT